MVHVSGLEMVKLYLSLSLSRSLSLSLSLTYARARAPTISTLTQQSLISSKVS